MAATLDSRLRGNDAVRFRNSDAKSRRREASQRVQMKVFANLCGLAPLRQTKRSTDFPLIEALLGGRLGDGRVDAGQDCFFSDDDQTFVDAGAGGGTG
jgi:hypothetical protein